MLEDDGSGTLVDVPWVDFLLETTVELSAGEGEKTVYAQFSVIDPVRGERLRTEPMRVNVKCTSTDRLGTIGRGEGIAAMAVVLLEPAP